MTNRIAKHIKKDNTHRLHQDLKGQQRRILKEEMEGFFVSTVMNRDTLRTLLTLSRKTGTLKLRASRPFFIEISNKIGWNQDVYG